MPAAVLTPLARAELRAAARHIAEDNPEAARALVAAIAAAAARIGAHPLIGAERPAYAPAPFRFLVLRSFPYILVYDSAAAPPRVLRVVHGARDLPGLLATLRA
jgi:toxin ParE1/3/4